MELIKSPGSYMVLSCVNVFRAVLMNMGLIRSVFVVTLTLITYV